MKTIETICKSVKDKTIRQHIRSKFTAEWTAASQTHGLSKGKQKALEWAQFRADTANSHY